MKGVRREKRRGKAASVRGDGGAHELDDESVAIAVQQAQRIAQNLQIMADAMADARTPPSRRQAYARHALGYARANPEALYAESLAKTSKLRVLLHHVDGIAAGVKRWTWTETPAPDDTAVAWAGGTLVAVERAAANLEAAEEPGVRESVDTAVAQVLGEFERVYPEERDTIDRAELRKALLLWLDTDRGRRTNADARAKKSFGGGDKFARLAKAIAQTSFATTAKMIEKEQLARRRKLGLSAKRPP